MNSPNANFDMQRKSSSEMQDENQLASPETLSESKSSSVPKLYSKSRKISKKRNKYQKIDDEIRLKLVEAVEKNGEMLKTAAKRFKINYSSAKSIFHTYRKEGRILKKLVKDRYKKKSALNVVNKTSPNSNPAYGLQVNNLKSNNLTQMPNLGSINALSSLLQPQLSNSLIGNLLLGSPIPLNQQSNMNMLSSGLNDASANAYNKTMEALIALKKLQGIQQQPRINLGGANSLADKLVGQSFCGVNSPTSLSNQLNVIQNSFQSPIQNNPPSNLQTPPSNNRTFNFDTSNSILVNNPAPPIKSNNGLLTSPKNPNSNCQSQNALSSIKKNLETDLNSEGSNSGILCEKMELETDLMHKNDLSKTNQDFECKKEFAISKAETTDDSNGLPCDKRDGIIRPEVIKDNVLPLSPINPIHLDSFKNLRVQKMETENPFKNTIENAAMDTIKTAISAQFLLGEALKKAALLNNLMNLQAGFPKN